MNYKWLAGFFDGEGTVFISWPKQCKNHDYHYLIVGFTQKDKTILDKIKEFVGYGSVSIQNKAGSNKLTPCNIYKYGCYSSNAGKLLKNILLYTQCKKMQIRYALQFLKYKTFMKPMTQKEIRWREMHRQLIRLYNK